MDRLDKLAVLALVVLAFCTLYLVVLEVVKPVPEGLSESSRREAEAKRYLDPAFDQKMALLKNMLAAGNLASAEKLSNEILAAYPFEAMVYMLSGDIQLRRQDSVAAVLAYRQAVDLNPDFLDKKTDSFQGKKIKKAVEEAMAEIEAALQRGDFSPEIKEKRKVMYYMLRKIAGSCS